MSDDIEVIDGEVVTETAVVPYTGEALTLLDMSYIQLAQVLDDAKRFEQEALGPFKREVREEVLRRMDDAAAEGIDGAWTVRAGDGWKLEGDSPNQSDYDVQLLRATLAGLMRDGHVKQEMIDKIIVPASWKVAKRRLAQLLKLGNPAVTEAVRGCERIKNRSVRVSRT